MAARPKKFPMVHDPSTMIVEWHSAADQAPPDHADRLRRLATQMETMLAGGECTFNSAVRSFSIITPGVPCKQCLRCLKIRALTSYRRSTVNPDGYQDECQRCRTTRKAAKQLS